MWTDAERRYLAEPSRLGRLATIGPAGPQVRPVGYRLNSTLGTVDIGGIDLSGTRKWRNIQSDDRVAFVVDDTGPADEFAPRGVEVRGRARTVDDTEQIIRIDPRRIVTWGLTSDSFTPTARTADDG